MNVGRELAASVLEISMNIMKKCITNADGISKKLMK